LTALKSGEVLYIEVKSPTGVQSKDQIQFEKDVKASDNHYILARSVEDVNDYICKNLWKTGVLF